MKLPFILCLTGMPGSGKTTVAHAIENMGFYYISLGDVVRQETISRGLEVNDRNCGFVMKDLREKLGPHAIAQLSLKHFPKDKNFIVIDGIRSIYEVQVYRSIGCTKLLAIHASPDRRYNFLVSRGRKDAPSSREDFDLRDRRELEVGIGDAIALSDEIISNNSTLGALIRKVKNQIKLWLEEDI
ncbi:MAG: AAA family ATPase [Nitrososphaeria archaeon]|nr:AAA family ATPase [Nitrososphaeria archaeon]